LKRRDVSLYLVTMGKVLIRVHISDVSHGSPLSKNYMVQCFIELTRNSHLSSSIISCSVVCVT